MKKILLMSILLISLMLIAMPVGYAANPPPPGPGEKFVGPAIVGTILITSAGAAGVTAIFSGQCRGIQFTLGPNPYPGSFDEITPEGLEGQTLGFAGEQIPLDCAPSKGGYDTEVKIFNITKFTKIGNVITADAVALSLVSK